MDVMIVHCAVRLLLLYTQGTHHSSSSVSKLFLCVTMPLRWLSTYGLSLISPFLISQKFWIQFWVALSELYQIPLWNMLKSKMYPFLCNRFKYCNFFTKYYLETFDVMGMSLAYHLVAPGSDPYIFETSVKVLFQDKN